MVAAPAWATDFKGVEIRVGVQDASAIGSPADAHARTWEARTGGRVSVAKYPFGQLFERLRDGIARDPAEFDVILYAPAWAGDFFPFLSELPVELAETDAFDDVHPTYRERLMTWDGKWIAVTVDGDLFSGYYRKDLFEDAAARTAFKARHGYELRPPETWSEYRDIAAFFTGRADRDGKPLYGTAEAYARGGQQFWDVFSRVSAYVNHPAVRGAQFFDPDTMKAQVNNEGWLRGVGEYVENLKFAPPDAKSFGIVQVREAFIGGSTAMALDWGDTAQISADRQVSRIADQVGYFVLPGTHDAWNIRSGRWDHFDEPHKAPFLAFGGWVASVPATSRNQEAAWDYVMWYSSPENSMRDVVKSGTGINPYRYSHFVSIDQWADAFSPRAAREFLGVIKSSLDSPNVALDLRIPGFYEYTESFEINLTKALDGEISAKEAMDRTAADWERITDRLGRDRQKRIYRASQGLPAE